MIYHGIFRPGLICQTCQLFRFYRGSHRLSSNLTLYHFRCADILTKFDIYVFRQNCDRENRSRVYLLPASGTWRKPTSFRDLIVSNIFAIVFCSAIALLRQIYTLTIYTEVTSRRVKPHMHMCHVTVYRFLAIGGFLPKSPNFIPFISQYFGMKNCKISLYLWKTVWQVYACWKLYFEIMSFLKYVCLVFICSQQTNGDRDPIYKLETLHQLQIALQIANGMVSLY